MMKNTPTRLHTLLHPISAPFPEMCPPPSFVDTVQIANPLERRGKEKLLSVMVKKMDEKTRSEFI
jgi:hypothetical protein